MARRVLALLLPALAAAQCPGTQVRVGTFGDANPEALVVMTDWLNAGVDCWTFYRQSSGGRSIAKLDSGDLDIALLGSTPFAAAVARRGALKAVSVAHIKGSAEALITRARFNEPKDLADNSIKADGTTTATIAAPSTSTTHYVALAVIANAGMDLISINLEYLSPDEIAEAWDAGTIDGACIWGTTMQHMLNNFWNGSTDEEDKGRAMVDATTVAQWDYVTGNVLAATDDFLLNHADLVETLVKAFEQTRYDYRKTSGEDAVNWGEGGTYNNIVAEFAALSATTTPEQQKDTYDLLAKFDYRTVADQIDFDLPTMTQDSAYFFYEQKVLAEDPSGADQTSHYKASYDTSILASLAALEAADPFAELYATLLEFSPLTDLFATTATAEAAATAVFAGNVQQEDAGDPKCAAVLGVASLPQTLADGSTGTHAYAADADCTWVFGTSDNYINLDITKLMSEQPDDGLEVYAENGDLLAAFTGRWDPSDLPQIRASAALGGVTIRWTTDSYDENAIGLLEDVGFEVVASLTSAGPLPYDHCLGVSTPTEPSGTIQASSQASYAPNSRCGWRIETTSTYVELDFTALALENGVDFVRIYAGSVAPAGLRNPRLYAVNAPTLLYAATGSTLPGPLIFEGSVFVTFESDGLMNAGGFELAYRGLNSHVDIQNSCDGDWTTPVKNCALDHCTGTQDRALVSAHGAFSSSSGASAEEATNYPAMTACRWRFTVPTTGLAGLSMRAPVWDIEASGALTSTTDAVKIYNDGNVIATLKGGDVAQWEVAVSGTSGAFEAVFETDLNNPSPKKGFDLVYAGKYSEAAAGAAGGFCLCGFGEACAWPCAEEAPACGGMCFVPSSKGKNEVDMGLVYGIVFGLFLPLLVLIGVFLFFYRRKMKRKSAAQKAIISDQQQELQAFRDSVVGMRAVVQGAAPGGTARPPAAPAKWYWEESPARLAAHPHVKPPHWIPYDAAAAARLEQAFATRAGTVMLTAAYEADVQKMVQTNLRTKFSRRLLRDAPAMPIARPSSHDMEQGADRPPDIDADEPCMVLHVGSIVQIARQRDDGWAFGSLMLAAAGAPTEPPPDGWALNQGWFDLERTEAPSADQLAELQKALGGNSGSALDPPDYWGDVKDPLTAEFFRLDPRNTQTRAEYKRVEDAFLLTLDRANFRIHSIDRVQNISLWQSYSVKKSQICAREQDEKQALRKYVRCWLFHGCPGDIVAKITQQGFNRSFCGKNATFYGKGVYFARDASYSTYPLYCRPDANGVQSIFLVRAVVGQYSQGVKDALTPDVRDAARNLLYDSTVDVDPRRQEPSVYVTYHDAQAYPEYLIRFSQTNVPSAHPQAGMPAHRMYRHNILEAEGIE